MNLPSSNWCKAIRHRTTSDSVRVLQCWSAWKVRKAKIWRLKHLFDKEADKVSHCQCKWTALTVEVKQPSLAVSTIATTHCPKTSMAKVRLSTNSVKLSSLSETSRGRKRLKCFQNLSQRPKVWQKGHVPPMKLSNATKHSCARSMRHRTKCASFATARCRGQQQMRNFSSSKSFTSR